LYLQYLQKKIQGDWSATKDTWLSCPIEKQSSEPTPTNIVCPQKWGQELNPLNCEHIWNFEQNEDLANAYYDRSVALDLPDKLLAMAAVRLASTLNAIFANSKVEGGRSFLFQSSTSQGEFSLE
jgi:hypothetical protein